MLRGIAITLCGIGLAVSLWFFHEFYWRWRDCFNELGRCFDEAEGVVYHQQSGEVTGVVSFLFALGLISAVGRRR